MDNQLHQCLLEARRAEYDNQMDLNIEHASFKQESTDDVLLPPQPKQYEKSKTPQLLAMAVAGFAAGIFFAILAPVAVLLAYIFALNSSRRDGMYLITGAKSTRIIAITQAIGTVAGLVDAPMMSMMGTTAAARWWAASHGGKKRQTPTPMHAAVTMSVLGAANLSSMWQGMKLLRRAKKRREKTVALPNFVKTSIILLTWTLLLHYMIAFVDFAFHLDIEPSSVIQQPVFVHENTSHHLFSRPLNQTKCDEFSDASRNKPDFVRYSCGTQSGASNVVYLAEPEGLRTLSNSSTTYSVAWADDGTALMVPGVIGNLSYSAHAMGVRTTCQSITRQCLSCSLYNFTTDNGAVLPYEGCKGTNGSSMASINFSCPSTTPFNTTTDSRLDKYNYGILNTTTGNLAKVFDAGGNYYSNVAPTNPFIFGFVAQSVAYASTFGGKMILGRVIGDTGFVVAGMQGGVNVLYCSVEVLETTYKFSPPAQYTLLTSRLAPLKVTKMYAAISVPLNTITASIEGVGVSYRGGQTYVEAAGQRISRVMVAMAAVVHDATPIIEAYGTPVVGARFNLPLLAVLVTLAMLLALTALFVGCVACIACLSVKTPAQAGVESLLMKPYAIWAALYQERTDDTQNALSGDGLKLFRKETEDDRLCIVEARTSHNWQIEAQK